MVFMVPAFVARPGFACFGLVYDRQGLTIWASTTSGLARHEEIRWQPIGPDSGLTHVKIRSVRASRSEVVPLQGQRSKSRFPPPALREQARSPCFRLPRLIGETSHDISS